MYECRLEWQETAHEPRISSYLIFNHKIIRGAESIKWGELENKPIFVQKLISVLQGTLLPLLWKTTYCFQKDSLSVWLLLHSSGFNAAGLTLHLHCLLHRLPKNNASFFFFKSSGPPDFTEEGRTLHQNLNTRWYHLYILFHWKEQVQDTYLFKTETS